jgi:adenine-specific DNA-methyltransferase
MYSQLIPYIGNKRRLLPLIAEGLETTGVSNGSFVDLFSGSTVVARLAKSLGFRVLANDWEPYSHRIAAGTVALNRAPAFEAFGGAHNCFARLNTIDGHYGYIARHLCPKDDEAPDLETERMFFTRENGERIDAVREQLASWEAEGWITPAELSYALSALLYSVSYVSNTSGLFKAFHQGWGGKTGTALYRIRSRLQLVPPCLLNRGVGHIATREDAQELAGTLEGVLDCTPDIVYLDPPYNQHPYGSNYHVLNTVALWDKPSVNPSTRVGSRSIDKSAIRKDWRTARRSPYNSARLAATALESLLDRLTARWVLMSYSTDGNIPTIDVLRVFAERGTLRLHCNKYKRYRVSTPRMSARSHNVEFLIVLGTHGPTSRAKVPEFVDAIERAGRCEATESTEQNELFAA